jgi:hypothetical protein
MRGADGTPFDQAIDGAGALVGSEFVRASIMLERIKECQEFGKTVGGKVSKERQAHGLAAVRRFVPEGAMKRPKPTGFVFFELIETAIRRKGDHKSTKVRGTYSSQEEAELKQRGLEEAVAEDGYEYRYEIKWRPNLFSKWPTTLFPVQ